MIFFDHSSGLGFPQMSGMFQTPAMQAVMQQVSSNPDMMQNMMQSPYMQGMMNQMMANPELMASVSWF